jgi:ABC-2 type transport system permease protein
MLKALIRTRLQALGSSLTRASSKKRTNGFLSVLLALLLVYAAGCFVFLFFLMDTTLCSALHDLGIGWMYWAMSAFLAAALGCFLTMLLAEHQLFSARDNEMLLALPIPPRHILFSRMCMLLLMVYFIAALVIVPAAVVYQMQIGFTGAQAALLAVQALTLPLFALALACLAGWVLAYLSGRARHKSLVSVLASVILIGLYLAGVSMANRAITYIVQFGVKVSESIAVWGAPLYWFGIGVDGSAAAALGVAALNIAVFALVYVWLAKNFYKITTMHRGAAKVQYTEKKVDCQPVGRALLQNQLRHFGAAPGWIVNGAIGALMGIIAGAALIFKRDMLQEVFAQFPGTLPAAMLLAAALAFCVGMSIISSACISLEAKTLWILQSSPLAGGKVLQSMAALQLTVTLPASVLASILGSIGLELSPLAAVAVILALCSFCVLGAEVGVWCNLHFPKFDWLSETQAVKQGISSLISMLLTFLILIAAGGIYFLLSSCITAPWLDTVYLLALAAVFGLGSLALRSWMNHKGAAMLAEL